MKDRIVIGHAIHNDLKVKAYVQFYGVMILALMTRFRLFYCLILDISYAILNTMLEGLR